MSYSATTITGSYPLTSIRGWKNLREWFNETLQADDYPQLSAFLNDNEAGDNKALVEEIDLLESELDDFPAFVRPLFGLAKELRNEERVSLVVLSDTVVEED